MNTRTLATLCLATLTVAAPVSAAENRMQAVVVERAFEVSCAAPRVPGQQRIARDFGIANLGQAYELRLRLQHVVTRACQGEADRVRVTLRAPGKADESLRYVALQE